MTIKKCFNNINQYYYLKQKKKFNFVKFKHGYFLINSIYAPMYFNG